MSWKVYELICNIFLEGDDEEYIFAHAFLTLEWNLMSRSENVVDCHAENLVWTEDALGFHFPRTKTDQLGKRSDAIWHVYATPNSPSTCCHLALARYLFANPGILLNNDSSRGSNKLFPGSNQYERFMKVFHRVMLNNEEAFQRVGVKPGDLGSHSTRKGACSLAASGSTVSPPIVSICLRAMWSMGGIKERYLHFENAGDQYLGRVVAGLDCNEYLFAVSPPYFDLSTVANEEETEKTIDELVARYLVGGNVCPPRLFVIFRYLFASLCYHSEFLSKKLHPKNKLQASPFFTSIPKNVQGLATIKFPWNSTKYTPPFTGLPPHVSLLLKIEGLTHQIDKMKCDFLSEMNEALDKRGVGSESFFCTKTIQESIEHKFDSFTVNLFAKLSLNTHLPNTFVNTSTNPLLSSDHSVFAVQDTALCFQQDENTQYSLFVGKEGIMRRLPDDYVFPCMTFALFISYWFCGDKSKNLVPICVVDRKDVKLKGQKNVLSKMKKLMNLVEVAAKREGVWKDSKHYRSDVQSCNELSMSVQRYFSYPTKNDHVRRFDQLSWKTYINMFRDHGGVFACDMAGQGQG